LMDGFAGWEGIVRLPAEAERCQPPQRPPGGPDI
jgi:hypothetical protein